MIRLIPLVLFIGGCSLPGFADTSPSDTPRPKERTLAECAPLPPEPRLYTVENVGPIIKELRTKYGNCAWNNHQAVVAQRQRMRK